MAISEIKMAHNYFHQWIKRINMIKKISIVVLGLLAVVSLSADSFDGVINLKVLESYSSKFVKATPYLYSGADTCEVYIKGDMIHLFYKKNGIHKIIRDGRIYFYSDVSKKGFDIPACQNGKEGVREEITTDVKRMFGDDETTMVKHTAVYHAYVLEQESWVLSNKYQISPVALHNLYTFVFSQICLDFKDPQSFCMKSASKVLMSSRTAKNLNVAAGIIGNASVAGKDKSQAENAATNEYAQSHSFEVISIKPATINDEVFAVPADVETQTIEGNPTFADAVRANAEIYPFMENLFKGKFGEAAFANTVAQIENSFTCHHENATEQMYKEPKSIEDDIYNGQIDFCRRGWTMEESAAIIFYQTKEQAIIANAKEIQKKKSKKNNKKNESQPKEDKVIICDINEQWDF